MNVFTRGRQNSFHIRAFRITWTNAIEAIGEHDGTIAFQLKDNNRFTEFAVNVARIVIGGM